jgi:hypothetical protein
VILSQIKLAESRVEYLAFVKVVEKPSGSIMLTLLDQLKEYSLQSIQLISYSVSGRHVLGIMGQADGNVKGS